MPVDFTWWQQLWDPATPWGKMSLLAVVIVAAWLVNRMANRLIIRTPWVVGQLKRAVDPTVLRYAVHFKTVIIIALALSVYTGLVPGLHNLMGTLVAGAGITALILGFAAKSSLANLISGLSLAVYRPVRIGDKVQMDGEYGTIEDITLRHTILRTWQNRRLIIPNEKLDRLTIVNNTIVDPRILCTVKFGVSYDTDLDLARRLLLEEAANCPQRMPNAEAEPWVRVISHGDFSIGLRLYLWTANSDEAWGARFHLLEQVKKRFDREGVEIPFPYRTLVYKNDLPAPRREPEQPQPETDQEPAREPSSPGVS